MRSVRIFVSSPNDALSERRRVSRVVDRLNAALADTVHLDAVRWEERFYAAHDAFQPQIPRSGECDIVIAVLRGRIGSPLSAAFHEALPPEEKLPPGQSYASGTAYEILSAIRARREKRRGELPDVYVFRWPTPPQISLDAPDRMDVEMQWSALKRFTDEVFLTAEGQFKGAYQTYASLDDFEAQTETLLRDWLKRHVLGDRTVLWPAERGSPFRGLAPFGMRHAAVFFGRGREIARAAERLKASASLGVPVQLVIGPSGAGKSSFLRAGLVPRLIAPGEVDGVGVWRVALMRPGESPDGPVTVLARRLFERADEIDPAEAGRPAALPEIAEGAFPTPDALGRLLTHADETAAAPILAALDHVADAGRQAWGSDRPEPARLLLVVDQLDEVFATAVTDEQRSTFARVLDALARTGAVWVVMSLRAEFYEAFLKSPLAALAGDERTLTLKPPGMAEMAEIVREPAAAADLEWEKDPTSGERLDERLLADIDRPDLLPLLQFVLDRLYRTREGTAPQRMTFAAYRALGTLDGAIREEAERTFAILGPAEQAALPRLLRGLIVPAQAGSRGAATFALIPAPLATVAPTEASRRLVAALADARLLTTGFGEDGTAIVGLAHQRVIEAWDRARQIVAESAGFQRVRVGIASRRRDWEGARRTNDLLLPRGSFLAQAEEIAASYGDEIPDEDLAYLRASRRHASRALRRAYAAAGVFAVVAAGAAAASVVAYQQRERAETERGRAERNFTVARETVDRVVSDVAQGLRNVEGLRVATQRRILGRVETAMAELTRAAPGEPAMQRSRAAMLVEFGQTYWDGGDTTAANDSFKEAVDIDRALLQRDPGNLLAQRSLVQALSKLGFLNLRTGNSATARATYEEQATRLRSLAKQEPDTAEWPFELSRSLGRIAELEAAAGHLKDARAHYLESLTLIRALVTRDPTDNDRQFILSIDLDQIATLGMRLGDVVAAGSAYEEALSITRAMVAREPDNTRWQRELAFRLDKIGAVKERIGDVPAAAAAFGEALAIRRALVKRDPDNSAWLGDLTLNLGELGDVRRREGDLGAARSAYDESVAHGRTLIGREPANTLWQRRLWGALNRLGSLDQQTGDLVGATTVWSENLAMARGLFRRDPTNTEWQFYLSTTLTRLGALKAQAGDAVGAQADSKEGLSLARALLAHEPNNLRWQVLMSTILSGLGDRDLRTGDASAARASFEEVVALRRTLAQREPDNPQRQRDLAEAVAKLADERLKPDAGPR